MFRAGKSTLAILSQKSSTTTGKTFNHGTIGAIRIPGQNSSRKKTNSMSRPKLEFLSNFPSNGILRTEMKFTRRRKLTYGMMMIMTMIAIATMRMMI